MEITVSQQQARVPVTIFHIKGEINTETYEQLQKRAQQAMGAGARYLLLYLAQVTYVSSYGIRAISQVFSWLRDSAQGDSAEAVSKGMRDGKFKSLHLKLVNPTPQVLKVLTTSGVDMFLEIHHGLNQAIASF